MSFEYSKMSLNATILRIADNRYIVLNNIHTLQMGPSPCMDGWKKTLSSTVEAIHASIETLVTIEHQ
jgi:hypothetical protein